MALGAFTANLISGAPTLVALAIGIGNTLEAVLGAYLLRRFEIQNSLRRVADVFRLLLFGAVLPPLVNATIGASSLFLAGIVTLSTYAPTWGAWWLGDALGIMAITPLAITWYRRIPHLEPREYWELALLLLFLIPPSIVIFSSQTFLFAYLVFPPLLFAAVRFGQRLTTVAAFLLTVIAIWGVTGGLGPFPEDSSVIEKLFKLQMFMGVVITSSLILAAAVAERRELIKALRHHAEELELRQKSLELQTAKDIALFDSVGEAIVAIDQERKIFMVNRAFEELFGRSREELIGRNITPLFKVFDASGNPFPDEERPIIQALTSVARITELPCSVLCKNGIKLPVMTTASPLIWNGEVIGAASVLRDIRPEKEIDQAKSEFVSLASHQLRTPLSIINWHLEAVLNGDTGKRIGAKERRYLRESYSAAKRLFGMVNALLTISRIEANTFILQPKPVNIVRFVNGILNDFEPEIAKKKLRLERRFNNSFPDIAIDETVMRITLENLLSNAVKYTPPGGSIRVGIAQRNGEIQISVADTGCGIPPKSRHRVFTKFFRAENVALRVPDGNGLGLYVVKSMLDRSGGRISFTSREHKGSRFSVSLPLEGMRSKEDSTALNV